MQFINHTPFDSIGYAGVTPAGDTFDVVALKMTLMFASDGSLTLVDEQPGLTVADTFHGEPNVSSVSHESDFCHWKPRCDVMVRGAAHAPDAQPVEQFSARLQITSAAPRSGPESGKPSTSTTSETLLSKTLSIAGPRWFVRRNGIVRLTSRLVRLATLGIVRIPDWRLTKPTPIATLPLRYEHALGGYVRVQVDEPAAKRVAKLAWRPGVTYDSLLKTWQENGQSETLAEAHSPSNPIGTGFAPGWWLNATRTHRVSAPQIELAAARISVGDFLRASEDRLPPDLPIQIPAGFGALNRPWSPRCDLLGTVDDAFVGSDAPLPHDFDFAYWNAAPLDQQINYLHGGETIELTNLSPEGRLAFQLPNDKVFALIEWSDGDIATPALHIDTMLIDTDARKVYLTWRLRVQRSEGREATRLEVRWRNEADDQVRKRQVADWLASLVMTQPAPETSHG
jgi:hypothetical protein